MISPGISSVNRSFSKRSLGTLSILLNFTAGADIISVIYCKNSRITHRKLDYLQKYGFTKINSGIDWSVWIPFVEWFPFVSKLLQKKSSLTTYDIAAFRVAKFTLFNWKPFTRKTCSHQQLVEVGRTRKYYFQYFLIFFFTKTINH